MFLYIKHINTLSIIVTCRCVQQLYSIIIVKLLYIILHYYYYNAFRVRLNNKLHARGPWPVKLDWIYQEHDKIVKNDSSCERELKLALAVLLPSRGRAPERRDCINRGRRNRAAATGTTRFFSFFLLVVTSCHSPVNRRYVSVGRSTRGVRTVVRAVVVVGDRW